MENNISNKIRIWNASDYANNSKSDRLISTYDKH